MNNDEPTTEQRCKWAKSTLEHFKHEMGESGPVGEDDVADLIADLFHYCRLKKYDTENLLGTAEMNFRAESEEV